MEQCAGPHSVLLRVLARFGVRSALWYASGGARMQEGILSLMQMAKTAAALKVYQSSSQSQFLLHQPLEVLQLVLQC